MDDALSTGASWEKCGLLYKVPKTPAECKKLLSSCESKQLDRYTISSYDDAQSVMSGFVEAWNTHKLLTKRSGKWSLNLPDVVEKAVEITKYLKQWSSSSTGSLIETSHLQVWAEYYPQLLQLMQGPPITIKLTEPPTVTDPVGKSYSWYYSMYKDHYGGYTVGSTLTPGETTYLFPDALNPNSTQYTGIDKLSKKTLEKGGDILTNKMTDNLWFTSPVLFYELWQSLASALSYLKNNETAQW